MFFLILLKNIYNFPLPLKKKFLIIPLWYNNKNQKCLGHKLKYKEKYQIYSTNAITFVLTVLKMKRRMYYFYNDVIFFY